MFVLSNLSRSWDSPIQVQLACLFNLPLDFIGGPNVALPQMYEPAVRADEGGAEVVTNEAVFRFVEEAEQAGDKVDLILSAGAEAPGPHVRVVPSGIIAQNRRLVESRVDGNTEELILTGEGFLEAVLERLKLFGHQRTKIRNGTAGVNEGDEDIFAAVVA